MENGSVSEVEEVIPVAKACKIVGMTVGTIRNQIYNGTKTPFPVFKHPISGKLVALASDALKYREALLTKCRVDVGGRSEGEAR